MLTQRLSDVAMKVRIVPGRARWPDAHSSPAWAAGTGEIGRFQTFGSRAESAVGTNSRAGKPRRSQP